MAERGPENNTASGDIVMITVPPDPPYGAIFEPDRDGKALVLRAFDKINGKFGPLQKHGGIHYGDVLFGINDVRLDVVNYTEALAMLNDRNLIKKQLKFINGNEYYKRRRASGAAPISASEETNKTSFMSTVSRFRINETDPKKKFAEFEVKSQYRVPGNKIHKDIVHKWTIWRRYSEFEALNHAMKTKLGWLMNGIDFPPAHNFSLGKLEADFLEERKNALNTHWQSILKLDKVCEFTKHFCSEDLKRFLEVEDQLKTATLSTPEGVDGAGGAEDSSGGGGGVARLQKTASMRRRSVKAGGESTDVFGTGVTSVLGSQSSASVVAPPSRPTSTAISTSSSSSTLSSSTSSSSSSAPASNTAAAANKPPNPPPASKPPATTAAAPSKPPAASTSSSTAVTAAKPAAAAPAPNSDAIPPKPTGARANLFADIQRRRIE